MKKKLLIPEPWENKIMNAQQEEWAAILEGTGYYKILRRLGEIPVTPSDDKTFLAVYIDVEATGLNTRTDEVIELGMVPFRFTSKGVITAVCKPFHSYNQPTKEITPEITKITGITNDMVKGYKLDIGMVDDFLEGVDVVIAHNASYDRKMLERVSKKFERINWACSMTQIPWSNRLKRLEHILADMGIFYKAHNAVTDCMAGLYALTQFIGGPENKDDLEMELKHGVEYKTGMEHLIEATRKVTHHVWAIDAPFFKGENLLKARGYMWSPGEDNRTKAWHKEIDDAADEDTWLRANIYRGQTMIPARFDRLTAKERFSERG